MSLPTLKRNQLRDATETALQAITAGATYYTNLGQHTSGWRPKSNPFAKTEIPGCTVRDISSVVIQELTSNHWLKRLTVEVEIVCKDIDTYVKAVADVYTAMAADYTLGGLAIDVNSAGDTVDVDEDEFTVAGGTVTLLIDYETNRMEV